MKKFRHSKESIKKIKEARARQVITLETRKKMSESRKGIIYTKKTLKRMSDGCKKRYIDNPESHPRFGKHCSEELKQKLSNNLIGRTMKDIYGDKSEKLKENLRQLRLGKKHSEETKRKISLGVRKLRSMTKIKAARAKQIFPLKDTSIEVKIQNFLKQLNIDFFTHQYMSIEHAYQCDIFIPSMNLVVECDGEYWHKYPTRRDIDHIRTKELIENGFKVLRLWEFEINELTLKAFETKLKKIDLK